MIFSWRPLEAGTAASDVDVAAEDDGGATGLVVAFADADVLELEVDLMVLLA